MLSHNHDASLVVSDAVIEQPPPPPPPLGFVVAVATPLVRVGVTVFVGLTVLVGVLDGPPVGVSVGVATGLVGVSVDVRVAVAVGGTPVGVKVGVTAVGVVVEVLVAVPVGSVPVIVWVAVGVAVPPVGDSVGVLVGGPMTVTTPGIEAAPKMLPRGSPMFSRLGFDKSAANCDGPPGAVSRMRKLHDKSGPTSKAPTGKVWSALQRSVSPTNRRRRVFPLGSTGTVGRNVKAASVVCRRTSTLQDAVGSL